jgi:hypothetical protein
LGKEVMEPGDNYTFLNVNWNENQQLRTGFSVHKGIVSPVKGVGFVSDMISYKIIRGSG